VNEVRFVEVRQSMRNGGGPACLRLRVVLTDDELRSVYPPILFTDELHRRLRAWVERHYRDHLEPADLADPKLLDEARAALATLMEILELGEIYSFPNRRLR
jgi:succinylarginine dihydrolase